MTTPVIDVAVALMLVDKTIKRATKYYSPKRTMKVTRQRPPSGRERGETFLVSVGKPNFAERKFIADCQKAGEKFPVRKLLVTHYPRRKRRAV